MSWGVACHGNELSTEHIVCLVVQRGEKLLKPLPDKPVPCDKLPDGPEPVAVEVEYIAREALEVSTGLDQLPRCEAGSDVVAG